jgi:hypothetical protein
VSHVTVVAVEVDEGPATFVAVGLAAADFAAVAVGLAAGLAGVAGVECRVASAVGVAELALADVALPAAVGFGEPAGADRSVARVPLLTVKPLEGTFTIAAARLLPAAGWAPVMAR